MFYSADYLMFVWPGLALALFATFYTKSTFAKYSRVASRNGLTGAEAAEVLLRSRGVQGVSIERADGFLSDHYDPSSRKLRLSSEVYDSRSLAAIGVACHEAGHALQHADGYGPLALRSGLVPVANFGSYASYAVLLAGWLMGSMPLLQVGALLFGVIVLFSLVTLPVEWNASARAKELMVSAGVVTASERARAGQVLNAAFLTYVASAVSSALTFLYYLSRFGLLGRRD